MNSLPREEGVGVCLWPATSLQLLLEKIPAVLWTADSNLRLTSLAGAGLSSNKLDPNDHVGRPLHEFLNAVSAGTGPLMEHTRALRGFTSVFDLPDRKST